MEIDGIVEGIFEQKYRLYRVLKIHAGLSG